MSTTSVFGPVTLEPAVTVCAPRSRLLALPRLAVTALLWAALGVGTVIIGLIAASPLLGYRVFTVMSGSMVPSIGVGDLVVTQPLPARQARAGDVITFSDPEGSGRLITHRVRLATVEAANVQFVTKGDANNTVERWSIPASGTLGRVEYRVPRLGYVMRLAGSPAGRIALMIVPALLLGASGLKRIWRPAEGRSRGSRR